MSGRPLELRIYPPIPPKPSCVALNAAERCNRSAWWDAREREDDLRERKRLTDAELAAECWHQSARSTAAASNYLNSGPGQTDAALDHYRGESAKSDALFRFATHPHYDET